MTRSLSATTSVPQSSKNTLRHRIEDMLGWEQWWFDALARELQLSPADLEQELRHLERSLKRRGRKLSVTASRCRSCGYEFTQRTKLRPPSRCPNCKSEWIEAPQLQIQ